MTLAVIGGTGIDEMASLAKGRVVRVTTRFGSADVVETQFAGSDLLFVPRHGLGHSVSPSLIDYRAQVAALKKLEVKRVIGVCAVGSLTPDLPTGSFAVLTDFMDLTRRRADTFFDEPGGRVAHTDFTQPYCPEVSAALAEACRAARVRYKQNAVYVGVEGPRYESPAEVRLFASWGGDVVGMTNVPEVVLAREAGLCYGALAVATNLAVGPAPTPISHEDVRSAMREAGASIVSILKGAIERIPEMQQCACSTGSVLDV